MNDLHIDSWLLGQIRDQILRKTIHTMNREEIDAGRWRVELLNHATGETKTHGPLSFPQMMAVAFIPAGVVINHNHRATVTVYLDDLKRIQIEFYPKP